MSEVSSPGGAAEAAALVFATQEFVANGGGRSSDRRRTATSPRRTGGLVVSGNVGWWRSNSPLSPPRQATEFSGGCGGRAPPARRLVLVPSESEDLHDRIREGPTVSPLSGTSLVHRCLRRRSGTAVIALSVSCGKPGMKILPRQESLVRPVWRFTGVRVFSLLRGDHPIRVTRVDLRSHTLAAGRSEQVF